MAAATRADPVVILDPLDRSNNLGKGCYRARDVHKVFAAAELELAMLIVRPQDKKEEEKVGGGNLGGGSGGRGGRGGGGGGGGGGDGGNGGGSGGSSDVVARNSSDDAGDDGGGADELELRPERIQTETLFQGLFILERLTMAGLSKDSRVKA